MVFPLNAAEEKEIFGWKLGSVIADGLLPQLGDENWGVVDIRDVFMSLPRRYFEMPYYAIGWNMTENKDAPYGKVEAGMRIRLPGDGAQPSIAMDVINWDKVKGYVVKVTEEPFPGEPWTRMTTLRREGRGWRIMKIVKEPATPVE